MDKNEYYLFTVDYENNGKRFWKGQGGAAWNFALWTTQARNLNKGEDMFALAGGEGYALLTLFQECPGWNDGSANAPHPVCVEKGLTFREVMARFGR